MNTISKNSTTLFHDIKKGVYSWRIWYTLGMSDIRMRYSRSKIGQFWITISTGIFIGAIGSVNSILFQQDIHEFLPFLAANIICWYFIAGMINDGCLVFIQSENYIKQIALPFTTYILRVLLRNLLNFAHNLVLLPIIFLIYPPHLNTNFLLVPIGLLLNLIAGFFVVLIVGVLCTRFRDTPPIVNNFVQLAFFITPIMWPLDALRSNFVNFGIFNPFAAFLNIMSEPLRGILPLTTSYIVVLVCNAILCIIALPLFRKYRSRIAYWL